MRINHPSLVGKMMDLCAKLGNQSAVDVLENRLEDTADAG